MLTLTSVGPIAAASSDAISPPSITSGDDHRFTPAFRTNLISGSGVGSMLPKSIQIRTGPIGNGYTMIRLLIGLVA